MRKRKVEILFGREVWHYWHLWIMNEWVDVGTWMEGGR